MHSPSKYGIAMYQKIVLSFASCSNFLEQPCIVITMQLWEGLMKWTNSFLEGKSMSASYSEFESLYQFSSNSVAQQLG